MLSLEEGTSLVKVARAAVEKFFEKQETKLEKPKIAKLNREHGVFVTIKNSADDSLRGCIGYITPIPLYEGVQYASLSAAFRDPRFPPLMKDELENITFEVSVMTEPTLVQDITPENLKHEIKIGEDGLMISNGPYSGLLLPQVPVEQKWDLDRFIVGLCQKAGMTLDFLREEETKLWKFQCQIFSETRPKGKIEETTFGKHKK